jgi:hypothetical protein
MPRGSKPGERRGGRERGTPNKWTDVRAAFAGEGPEALKTIVGFMKDKAQPATIRIMAAREVLDRGFGRSPQMVRHSGMVGPYDLSKLTDEQLHTVYDILRIAYVGIGDAD